MGRKRESYRDVDLSYLFQGDPVSDLLHQDSIVRDVVYAAGLDPLNVGTIEISSIVKETGLDQDQIRDSLGVLAVSQAEIAALIARCS